FERFEGRMWRKGRPGAEVGRPPALSLREEVQRLAALYEEAAAWLERWAAAEADDDDHTTALFTTQVLHAPATDFRNEAATLRAEAGQPEPTIGPDRLEIGYRRLMATFEVRLSAFERKGYVNLSHEPNKAMNLNAYLSLLGRRWREGRDPDGRSLLLPARPGERGLPVPKADYVITLDADSLLLPGYALRLIHLLERPGNEKVAVAQTPYSAVPQAPGPLERIAGATTDLQYIVHQGFTQHRATFWVGANALLRTAALADIGSHDEERGFRVRRYIQDRTVIEDTESSVDLVREGWQLVNYPERLSFSATPPDFGALLIQRRRWANGGLIILPKLLGYLARQPRRRMREGLMRFHYLTSITGANLGLLALLAIPFPTPPAAAWLPVSAFPYFALYARDLRQVGYRRMDAVRAYALNLALIPVNLGGVLKSVQQAWTRRRIPFHRTPKVEGRTPVPRLYLLAELALVAYCALWGTLDLVAGRWAHAGFQVFNVALLGYAIVRFIGWRQLWADLTSPRRG
ncbi:MAG TPA: glycosyltransferase family 2 protein, partial [Acidimicrobiales bacterium]|nr:glycosyltransferase family 2 protein [Acidimicrobiales bacterium]